MIPRREFLMTAAMSLAPATVSAAVLYSNRRHGDHAGSSSDASARGGFIKTPDPKPAAAPGICLPEFLDDRSVNQRGDGCRDRALRAFSRAIDNRSAGGIGVPLIEPAGV